MAVQSARGGSPFHRGQGNQRPANENRGAIRRGQEAVYGQQGAFLSRGGPLVLSCRTITTSETALSSDHALFCDATAGAITVALPPAADVSCLTYQIKKVDASANAVTVNPDGAETVDGAATFALPAQWDAVTIQSNGTVWFVV